MHTVTNVNLNSVKNIFATVDDTVKWKEKFNNLTFNKLGATGLLVSQAGFGCYRVNNIEPDHKAALIKAITSGINLVETSSNYQNGQAEVLVGEVIKELCDENIIKREEVVVIAKGGYLQGATYNRSQELKKSSKVYPELVEFCEGFEHCIHPDFLAEELEASLSRLGKIDGYLLHNPEHYLSYAEKNGTDPNTAKEEYYNRIAKAFAFLEEQVANKKIAFYGISSNTFVLPEDSPTYTSLNEIIDIANKNNKNNNFKVIQFPMNLLETGGISEKNSKTGNTVMSLAKASNLGVLTNRPLNAVVGHKQMRLVEYSDFAVTDKNDIQKFIDKINSLENNFAREVITEINLNQEKADELISLFNIGQNLHAHWQDFNNYVHWKDTLACYFLLRIEKGVSLVTELNTSLSEKVIEWLENYLLSINETMLAISHHYKAKYAWQVNTVKDMVKKADKEWFNAGALDRIAIRALRTTSGISSVLVGMKQEEYVDAVLNELRQSVVVEDKSDSWKSLV